MAIAIIPQHRNPWVQALPTFLQNLVYMKLRKLESDQRLKTIQSDKVNARKLELLKDGWSPSDEGQAPDAMIGDQGFSKPVSKLQAYQVGGQTFVAPMQSGQFAGQPKQVQEDKPGKLQRKTRFLVKNGQTWAQDYNYDPQSGNDILVGQPYVSRQSADQASASWQAKRKVFMGDDGQLMAQDYDFNPKTKKRERVGNPYQLPKTVNIWDFLGGSGSGGGLDSKLQRLSEIDRQLGGE